MSDKDYWKLFEITGCIEDYLNYACTSEESQKAGRVEGRCESDARNDNRDYIIGNFSG